MGALGFLLESTIKASLVLLLALAATALLSRRSAALRHWILSAAIACAAAAPALELLIPSWPVPAGAISTLQRIARPDGLLTVSPVQPAGTAQPRHVAPVSRSESADAPTFAASRWLAGIWVAGVAICLFVLVAGLGRLAWIASRARRVVDRRWTVPAEDISREYGLGRPALLLQTDHPTLLVTWGCVQPKVILPGTAQQWTEDRARIVLAHELAHIKRRDWLIQMVAEIARAAYWFNPFMWIVCRRLRQESEHATDDAVLNHGVDGSEYAAHLLDLARAFTHHGRTWLPAAAIARPSSLERRVRAMLNDRLNRAPTTRSARIATVAVVLCMTVVLAAAQTFSTFSGSVFDQTNAYLPDVTLMLTNAQSGAKHEVKSDHTGHFEFVGLPPGDYSLETRIPGFAALRGTLTLTGQNAQRDLVLQVGSLQETVTVAGTSTDQDSSSGAWRMHRRPDPVCGGLPGGGIGMGGNIRAPRKVVSIKPQYPPHLRDANIGGSVVMDARIGTDGTVSSVQVVTAAHPDLAAAAVEAVRQWEFDSTILNCTKVELSMQVTVNFTAQ